MKWESMRGRRHPLQINSKGERVVIVGTGEWGAIAFEYLSYDSPHEVVAFSAESQFITSDTYYGLPVVPFEELAEAYPPDGYRVFVAVSSLRLNQVRRRLFEGAKEAGFGCISYISGHAFALHNAEVGENVFVQQGSALEFMTRVGNNVLVGCGACVGHSAVIEDDCYIGPGAILCGSARVGRGSFVGANSCISHGVSVAPNCMIGAGAVVLADTEPGQVYVGSPARPTGGDSLEVSVLHFSPGSSPGR